MNYKTFWDNYYKSPDDRIDVWKSSGERILTEVFKVPELHEKLTEGANVLDLGTGAGNNAFFVASQFPQSEVLGIDFSENAVNQANDVAHERGITNISFIHGDISQLEEYVGDKKFSFAMDFNSTQFLLFEGKTEYVQKLADVLEDEAYYLFKCFDPEGSIAPKTLSKEVVMNTFGKHFSLEARKAKEGLALYLFKKKSQNEKLFSEVEALTSKERREKLLENTTLIIPNNDGESVMIRLIAERFGIDTRVIVGDWNLPKQERDEQLKALSGFKDNIIAVELAAPDIEDTWKKEVEEKGHFAWIDHHKYPALNRVRGNEEEERVGSSLDQFLGLFGLNEPELYKDWEYDYRFIKGVSLNDEGFIKALVKEGYSQKEIQAIRDFDKRGQYGEQYDEIKKKNEDAYKEQIMIGDNVHVIEFAEFINYTHAKDLAIYEHIQQDGEKVILDPVSTFIVRPIKEGMVDVAFEMLGYNEKTMKIFMDKLNSIQLDKRGSKRTHWWKAELTEEQLEEVKLFLKQSSM